ncbi:MAG: acyl-ACP--UDP-N-acetylglucosamine O-acyltransferase [Thermoanaerobaculia bacterium]
MTVAIHPTAVVETGAELGTNVKVGAYAVIGGEVVVGDDSEIGSAAQLQGPTTMGPSNRVFPHACIGLDPQDLKYRGERTTLEIGSGNTFREFCTVNRGTGLGGGRTTIGNENLLMAYTHVAHDCHVGDHAILTNAATLAGHVLVGDYAAIGAFSAVQQFCRVGSHAYIGGYSIITKDALPYMKTVGAKPACIGVNRVGLLRRGFDEDRIRSVESAARVLLRSGLNTTQALDQLKSEFSEDTDVRPLIDFIEGSEVGVITALPGKGRARGRSG